MTVEELEPVEMRQRRHNYFPHVFVWKGQEYQVEAVEQCWTIPRRGRENQVESYCYRVRAHLNSGKPHQEGIFDLFEDARTGAWHMQRQVR